MTRATLRIVQDRPDRRRRRRRSRGTVPRPERPPALPARPARQEIPARPRGRRPSRADELRAGTSCVILLDCREGEPDRSGEAATFDGYFDFETGELRRAGNGIPRLRLGDERLWGFECWWRPDPQRAGVTATDREDVETSKRLLRGLLRDARRGGRLAAR